MLQADTEWLPQPDPGPSGTLVNRLCCLPFQPAIFLRGYKQELEAMSTYITFVDCSKKLDHFCKTFLFLCISMV